MLSASMRSESRRVPSRARSGQREARLRHVVGADLGFLDPGGKSERGQAARVEGVELDVGAVGRVEEIEELLMILVEQRKSLAGLFAGFP